MRPRVFFFMWAGFFPAGAVLLARDAVFPVVGTEYLLPSPKRVLPPEACEDGHIVVVEEGEGSWCRVAYRVPSPFSWKPPQLGFVWINLDHVPWIKEVPQESRVIRLP